MRPIRSFLKDLAISLRIWGGDPSLIQRTQAEADLLSLVNDKLVPGIAVTVLKDGKLYFQKGYGYAVIESRTAADPVRSLFRTASASKPIAATALAKMVSQGIIELDTSFYEYVPYFPKKSHDFTLRQLAGHTAGIRGYRGKEVAMNKPYSIRESLVVFQDDPLLFRPGSSYLYNSFDWVLLSLAMEEASGLPFEEYVRQHVLEPLEMNNTKVEIPGRKLKDQAEFYTRTRSGFRKAVSVDNRYKLAGGGYLSTTSDLAKLGQAYLDDDFLDPGIAGQFVRSQLVNGKPTYYGLGWEVSKDKQRRPFYGHTGSSIGAYSNFYIYPEQKAVVAILVNCTDPQIKTQLDGIISRWLHTDMKEV